MLELLLIPLVGIISAYIVSRAVPKEKRRWEIYAWSANVGILIYMVLLIVLHLAEPCSTSAIESHLCLSTK